MYLLAVFPLTPEEISRGSSLGVKIKCFNSEQSLIDSDEVSEADAIIANHRTLQLQFLERCKKLKWIHVPHIGIERLPMDYLQSRNIIVTNSRGTAGTPISEDIFCKMLMLARKYHILSRQQKEHKWGNPGSVFNLSGKTIGILGTGDVATETAKKAKVFGMKTIGLNTTGAPCPYFDEVYITKDINKLIPESDFIVCTIPLTDKSYHLIDREQFELMKPAAFIINVTRANLFNEEVLFEYLTEKKIAGAALDVFTEEFTFGKLPPESPFWELDNLIISPHMAAAGDGGRERQTKIIMKNIECFSAGNIDEMLNIRDYNKGY